MCIVMCPTPNPNPQSQFNTQICLFYVVNYRPKEVVIFVYEVVIIIVPTTTLVMLWPPLPV